MYSNFLRRQDFGLNHHYDKREKIIFYYLIYFFLSLRMVPLAWTESTNILANAPPNIVENSAKSNLWLPICTNKLLLVPIMIVNTEFAFSLPDVMITSVNVLLAILVID